MSDELYDQEPAAGEWPLRIIMEHIVGAERAFFTLIHYGLAQQQENGAERPFTLPPNEVEHVTGSNETFYDITDNQPPAALQTYHATLRQRVMDELVNLTDTQLLGASPVWWEGEEYTLQYRLHRFDVHMRQHHIQIEQTLIQLNQPVLETHYLLRLLYRAFASVENAVLGASDLGRNERQALAKTILTRTAVIRQVISDSHLLETAVQANDEQTIQKILAAKPELANAKGQNGLSLLMNAIYQQKMGVATAFRAGGVVPDVFAAAALGDQGRLQNLADEWQGSLNTFAKDGFTPLQLACYFNRETAAVWLIEQGADVNAVAKNQMKITPLHAAATHGNLPIMQALLEKGANANAEQAGGFTAIHQAAHRNNVPMAELLLKFGANPNQPDGKDQSALQLAIAEENKEVAAILGG